MLNYIIVFLVSVFISSISQVILKTSANEEHNDKIREILNIKVIFAYGLFFSATLLTMLAYRKVPLSLGTVLETTGYVYVAILGRVVLKERLDKYKICGNLLIILGIIIFSLGQSGSLL